MNIHFYKRIIPFIYILLIGASLYSISTLQVNYLFENFFPKDNVDYIKYKEFREKFANDDRFIQIAIKMKGGIFNSSALHMLDSLENEILDYPDIIASRSLKSTRVPIKTPLGWITAPLLSINPENLSADSVSIMEDERLTGTFISNDGQYYAIQVKIRDSTSDLQNKAIIQHIESVLTLAEVENFFLGGFIYTQVNYVRLLEAEFPFAALASAISMCIVLLFLYRSVKNALMPTLTVLISLVLYFGYLGLIGRDLNITSTLFITIITIVAVSDIVHLQTYYHKYLLKNLPKGQSLRMALNDTWLNLFLTSLTTAIGFFTFLTSSIPHIRTFGFDAGVGVVLAFLIAITLGSSLLYYFPPSALTLQREKRDKKWPKFLHGIYSSGKKNRLWVFSVSVVIIAMSIFGIYRIENDQLLAGNFNENTDIKQSFNFYEENFGGIRALELHIRPKNEHRITDLEILVSLQQLEDYLHDHEYIGNVFSPVSWMKSQHQTVSGGRKSMFTLPMDQEGVEYLLLNDRMNSSHAVINVPGNSGRIVAKMKDIGRIKAEAFHEEIENWLADNTSDQLYEVTITGSALLVDRNNKNVIKEMVYSLALAFLCISILMAILFRRIKMIIISIVPNMVPLIAVAGLMGWIGLPLNAATSLIFTIGFVIAIDDTIHFLTRFRREYQGNRSLEISIKNTLSHTGKAILHTTIILIVVYTVSMFSSFAEIRQHSILVAATLIFALMADFYLLPALLRQAAKKKDLF